MLLFELLLGRRFVRRNTKDNRTGTLDFFVCVAEPARLYRSTRGVGLGIKKEDHVLAAIVLERYRFAFLIGKRELGGFIINFHGFSVFITSMNLYRRRTFLASLGLLALILSTATISAQRRTAHKLRATALLEVTTDQAGIVSIRVTPIAILDNGRFWDAGIYKAFMVRERFAIRFEATATNLRNRPNYNDPTTNISQTGNVGVIGGVGGLSNVSGASSPLDPGGPRAFRTGLRLEF